MVNSEKKFYFALSFLKVGYDTEPFTALKNPEVDHKKKKKNSSLSTPNNNRTAYSKTKAQITRIISINNKKANENSM